MANVVENRIIIHNPVGELPDLLPQEGVLLRKTAATLNGRLLSLIVLSRYVPPEHWLQRVAQTTRATVYCESDSAEVDYVYWSLVRSTEDAVVEGDCLRFAHTDELTGEDYCTPEEHRAFLQAGRRRFEEVTGEAVCDAPAELASWLETGEFQHYNTDMLADIEPEANE